MQNNQPRKTQWTDEDKQLVRELRERGNTYQAIAGVTGHTRSSITSFFQRERRAEKSAIEQAVVNEAVGNNVVEMKPRANDRQETTFVKPASNVIEVPITLRVRAEVARNTAM